MSYSAVILAAGKGVRMRSNLPKVVHLVAGKPMIKHVVNAVTEAGISKTNIIVGHGREKVYDLFKNEDIKFAIQEEQLGTGHALMQAKDLLDDNETIIVLAGDTPLLTGNTIKSLIEYHATNNAVATVVSTKIDPPIGYGRIIRDESGNFVKIVEEKDATNVQKQITEINTGIYCFKVKAAFDALNRTKTSNAQGEYYLTDILEILKNDNKTVAVYKANNSEEFHGINNRIQMSTAEKILRMRKNLELMENGVTIMDPETTFIDKDVSIGADTTILPFTIIQGKTVIGSGCEIGPQTRINDTQIGNNVVIENSRIKEAEISDACIIGPFAYIRPGTILKNGVKIGDFVEVKKSVLGENSKVPHLSYVGDALVGENVNIGAGTITCNYDGKNKFETLIEDGAFIGSNTNLVAPVKVGENALIGAGSTITRNVPSDSLAFERAKQKNISNWGKKKEKDD
ncbi:N-acetylglucosamine-1-phosphate uridyltransferase [Candidatus Syntrophocurvum alkaliphilum]|uniref:Bifunctional protein GlmU n=1 Tax=Candidatus Syntrophocurvum alkaliphilum TaxID=2293317 RepID=A0A6I6DDE5_9FIRM|nr:bifunctional UDP-N-acetylglucosamine diphosphorylase/glucosamine-1-phosphate N-acetyltransferase GlmU [Candidatus Syntrophocurvum alkaliphilum]QGU00542.1 N-acetylglucosamine-1-phosphate uridyltransferase [Candidatus Syntrophocurvum alkaliphilum]